MSNHNNREDYYDREDELIEKGGLNPIMAQYIARLEDGWSEEDIVDEYNLDTGLSVRRKRKGYNELLEQAKWILENGPDIDEISND